MNTEGSFKCKCGAWYQGVPHTNNRNCTLGMNTEGQGQVTLRDSVGRIPLILILLSNAKQRLSVLLLNYTNKVEEVVSSISLKKRVTFIKTTDSKNIS